MPDLGAAGGDNAERGYRHSLDPNRSPRSATSVEAAKALKAEGKTQAEVAARLGVARETVRNWFMQNGQKAKAHNPKLDAAKEFPPVGSLTRLPVPKRNQ